ncbi:hypothetical protein QJS10_CPA05g00005 [Acorus calamus]|uniref:ATP synthase delta chain n=1 Tax=Acorus calamus TaxID=4465 RepID=A0AAV9ETS0_ACOCL|nr:hypothetical protein QJS10_CPA05g00005 [Acorus calamus]
MSIINQSVTPNGQPIFSSKRTTTPDMAQHLSVAPLSEKFQSLGLSQPTQLKTSLVAAGVAGGSTQLDLLCQSVGRDIKSHGENDQLVSINGIFQLSQLHSKEEQFNSFGQPVTGSENGTACKSMSEVEFKPCTLNFLQSILQNDKCNLIKDAMGEGERLFTSEPPKTLVVTVCSAIKLERKQIGQITKKMQKMTGVTNVRLESTVDPSLIAGFIISYDMDGSRVIDLSVKGQLAELAAQVKSTDPRIVNEDQHWSVPGSGC